MIAISDLQQEIDPPTAPLRGALKLSGSQEKKISQIIKERIGFARNAYTRSGWMEKRNRAMREYMGNMDERKTPGSIFQLSNITLNLPKRFVRITAARIYDAMLTADPLIGLSVDGLEDEYAVPRVVERYANYHIEKAKIRDVLREAQLLALIRGETIVKTTWERKIQKSKKFGNVLIRDGVMVMANDGNPCRREDVWNETEDGLELARDKTIKLTSGEPVEWKAMEYEHFRVTFEGIECACVDHRDFICATTEKDIQGADFCGLRLDMELDKVIAMLGVASKTKEGIDAIRKLKSTAKSEANSETLKPEIFRGEEERNKDATPLCELAECYLRVQLEEDALPDEIAVLIDLKNDQLLAYDYLDNVSPTGQRPFRVIRMEPVPHRWYGTGFYELFADRHKFCDLFINRVNLAASLSGNIKIENPMATEEGMAGEPIEFGTNKTYRLREGFTAQDVFKVVTIPNDSAASENLLNMLMQITQLEAGIVSAGDHGLAGLPAASLATGIRSLDRVANVLLKNMLYDFILGFESVLKDCVALTLKNYSLREAELLMGPDQAKILAKNRDYDSLHYHAKIQLSNAKDSDVIEANKQAFDILVNFEQLPPQPRERLRPIIVKILSKMGIEDVDKALGPEAMAAEAASEILVADQPELQQGAPPSEENTDPNAPNVEKAPPPVYKEPPKKLKDAPIEDGQVQPVPERAE